MTDLRAAIAVTLVPYSESSVAPTHGDVLDHGRAGKWIVTSVAAAERAAAPTCDGCGKPMKRPTFCHDCASIAPGWKVVPAQAEPQPEAIPIAPVEVVRQALKELLESISECRMDQVTARFAKASVMARAVVDRYKGAT